MAQSLELEGVSDFTLDDILIQSYKTNFPIQTIFKKLMNLTLHLWKQTLELLKGNYSEPSSNLEHLIGKLEIISNIFCNFVAMETNDSYLCAQDGFLDLIFQWLGIEELEKTRLLDNSVFILVHLSPKLILTEQHSDSLKNLTKHLTIFQDPEILNQILEIIANLSLNELNQSIFIFAKNSNLFTQLEDLIYLNPDLQLSILLIFHNFALFGSMRTKLQIIQQSGIKKYWMNLLQTRPLPIQEAKLVSQTLLHLVSEPKTKPFLKPYELVFAELTDKSFLALDMASLLLHLS